VTPFQWTTAGLPAAAGGLSACHSGGETYEVARTGIGASGLLQSIPPGVHKIISNGQAPLPRTNEPANNLHSCRNGSRL